MSLTDEVEDWLLRLSKEDPDSAHQVAAAIDVLAAEGPTLEHPLVDRVKGSDYKNMKELRPGSAGQTEIRILFAFDPMREAILLVAGDKTGNWKGWYETSILEADRKIHPTPARVEGQSDGNQLAGCPLPMVSTRAGSPHTESRCAPRYAPVDSRELRERRG